MKSFFNIVNNFVGGEERAVDQQAKLPWEDYKEQAKGLGIRGSLKDVLRDEMSDIYTEEKRLLDKEKPLDDFNIDKKYDVIVKVLDNDLNLREFYRKVVPGKINEEFFWRNYFEITEEIKSQVLKRYASKNNPQKDLSEIRNTLLDELDKELEAEIIEPKAKVPKPMSEIEVLKQSLQAALLRIQVLEQRVSHLESIKSESSSN